MVEKNKKVCVITSSFDMNLDSEINYELKVHGDIKSVAESIFTIILALKKQKIESQEKI